MNFELSDDSLLLRDHARDFLRDNCASRVVRNVLVGREPYAKSLWREMADMGWLGTAIPEVYGGVGLGYEMLCVLALEIGRVLAPAPFASSIYLAAEAILVAGSETQKHKWLGALSDGSQIGCFALARGLGQPSRSGVGVRAEGGVLHGEAWPVADALIGDFAIVVAEDPFGIGLYRADLDSAAVEREALGTLDPSKGHARIRFSGVEAERLGETNDQWAMVERVLERAAILTAFEQVGGAEACLAMARDFAMGRYAFGRPLAGFQAIKHKLADVYVEVEIARANAYYGAWALTEDAAELPLAAAAARAAAIEAFRLAAKENIQTHGGAGFTWEFDCHLYYRRAQTLASTLGGAGFWKNRLIDLLEVQTIAQETDRGL